MGVESRNIERYLTVGAVAMLHTDPARKDGNRHKTIIRGWRKGNHVLIDRPRLDIGTFAALGEGQDCVLRYIHEGQACAFDTRVIDWDNRRHNAYVRITWPQAVEYMSFRRFERLKVNLVGLIQLPGIGKVPAEIKDISIGGCALLVEKDISDIQRIQFNLTLPDGRALDHIRADIKNYRNSAEGTFLGCEFCEGQPIVENEIAFFVTSMMEMQRNETPPELPKRVLIIDEDAEFLAKLRRQLDRQHLDCVTASNLIDGLHRLRATPPAALLISQQLPDLPGLEVCRIVRNCPDFKQMPVFVYGGDAAAGEAATLCGANAYFPAGPGLAPDLAFEVAQELGGKSSAA